MLFSNVSRREDPVLAHNFLIALLDSSSSLALSGSDALAAINESASGGFSECSGLEMTLEIEEYQQGGQNSHVLKFPTRTSWTNITLKRGVGLNSDLWKWYCGFVEGRGVRRDGVIVLQNDQHFPHTIWSFHRGLPAKYTGPALNAGQNNVAIEALDIAHEGLAMVPNEATGMIEIGTLVSQVF